VLLALDSSTGSAGVALHDGSRVLAESVWWAGRHHSEQLLAEVGHLLKLVETPVSALTAVAIALGPGSFTGVRVGLAIAKGIALGRTIPLYGVETLAAAADACAVVGGAVRAVAEAGRGRWVTATYRPADGVMQRADEYRNVDFDGLRAIAAEGVLLVGEMDAPTRQRLADELGGRARLAAPELCVRRPAFIAARGWRQARTGGEGDPARVDAIYLAR